MSIVVNSLSSVSVDGAEAGSLVDCVKNYSDRTKEISDAANEWKKGIDDAEAANLSAIQSGNVQATKELMQAQADAIKSLETAHAKEIASINQAHADELAAAASKVSAAVQGVEQALQLADDRHAIAVKSSDDDHAELVGVLQGQLSIAKGEPTAVEKRKAQLDAEIAAKQKERDALAKAATADDVAAPAEESKEV